MFCEFFDPREVIIILTLDHDRSEMSDEDYRKICERVTTCIRFGFMRYELSVGQGDSLKGVEKRDFTRMSDMIAHMGGPIEIRSWSVDKLKMKRKKMFDAIPKMELPPQIKEIINSLLETIVFL